MLLLKEKDPLECILEWGMFISFTILIVVVTLSVITRFLLPFIVLSWAEEASRFFFIYTVALGAPCSFKRREFATVDFLFNRLSLKTQKKLNIIFDGMIMILSFLIFLYSLQFAKLGLIQFSPTMGIPMVFAFSSMPITSFFITLYSTLNFFKAIGKRSEI